MKSFLLILLTTHFLGALSSADDSKTLLRDALFAEESSQDYTTAAKKYQQILQQHEQQRKIAVTAMFRLAEIQRKQGKNKEAAKLYRRLITEFSNMEPQNRMSRENLAALGEKVPEGMVKIPLDEESKELARLKKLEVTSPDIFKDPRNLSEAAGNNWLRVLAYLIQQGADANKAGALYPAAREGHLAACKLLLDSGCDPSYNSSALASAFHAGHTEVIKFLLKRGTDVKGSTGAWFPHHVKGHTPISRIKLIVGAGYNLNLISQRVEYRIGGDRIKGGTLLHQAIWLGYNELVEYLLAQKVDVNLAPDDTCITPLLLAAYRGDAKNAALLLRAGAKPNVHIKLLGGQKDNQYNGVSPLIMAIMRYHTEVGDLLLKANAQAPPDALKYALPSRRKKWEELFEKHGVQLTPEKATPKN